MSDSKRRRPAQEMPARPVPSDEIPGRPSLPSDEIPAQPPQSLASFHMGDDQARAWSEMLARTPTYQPPVQPAPQPQGGLMDWLRSTFVGQAMPGQPTTQDYIQHFQRMNPGNTEDAFRAAKDARGVADLGKSGFARDLNMRDAEHALFSQHLIETLGPLFGRLAVATQVPGYAAAKVAAQSGIPGAAQAVQKVTGMPLHQSTPPDTRELYWGLRPLFGRP